MPRFLSLLVAVGLTFFAGARFAAFLPASHPAREANPTALALNLLIALVNYIVFLAKDV